MGVALTPVQGDPFAQPQPKSPNVKLTAVSGDPFAPPPSMLSRVGSAVSNAFHNTVDFFENTPADRIVAKNQAAHKPQPDAFGSVAEAVPNEDAAVAAAKSPSGHAFVRSAGRGVLPSLTGAGGFGAGAAIGGTLTAPAEAIPIAGPVINGLGALVGGMLGAYGASSATDKVQDTAINALPVGAQQAIGQDAATRQADAQQHPIATFSGGLAPSLLTMRPGFSATPVAEDAPILTRLLSKPATGAVVGATMGGAQEAAREEVSGEGLDPTKLAIATGVGAVENRPTALGTKMFNMGGNAAFLGMQRTARGAGYAREGIFGRADQQARQPFDAEASATRIPQEQLPPPAETVPAEPGQAPGGVNLVPVKGDPFKAPAAMPGVGVTAALPAPVPQSTAAPEGQSVEPQPVAPPQGSELGQPAKPAEPEPTLASIGFKPAQADSAQSDTQTVRTPAGTKVQVRPEVVDASTLNKAEGALQNRDRSRDTSALQTQEIISKFDPELLGHDPSSDRGAPIVDENGTVLSGNGRMLALNGIYDDPAHADKAAAYRQFIEGQGHSTDGMDRPVLVRRLAEPMDDAAKRQFVVESNKDSKLELSPVERARSDADNVTPEMLAKYAGGDLNSTANAPFVSDFTKSLTAGEMGNVIGSDRRLTTPGIERIENAVVAKAYDNPKLLEKLMESSHNEIRAITSSLAGVAPSWAAMREAAKAGEIGGHYDITGDLTDAAMRVAEARKRGEKPADILTQQDAFDRMSPATEALIRAFYNPEMTRAASVKSVTNFLRDYIDEANAQKPTTDIFGETNPGKEPQDILNELLRQRDTKGGEALLDAPAAKENANVPRSDTAADGGGRPYGQSARGSVNVADSGSANEQRAPLAAGSDSAGSAADGGPNAAANRRDASTDTGTGTTGASEPSGRNRAGDTSEDGQPTGSRRDHLGQESGNGRQAEASRVEAGDHNGDRQDQGAKESAVAQGTKGEGQNAVDAASEEAGPAKRPADGAAANHTDTGSEPSSGTEPRRGGRASSDADGGGRPAGVRTAELDVPEEHQPSARGNYQPSFAEASFTDRQSAYTSAIDALGMDHDKFNLLPPQRKARLLADALEKLTGIKVDIAKDMPLQHAVDQLLDAHQTLQGMAQVLDLTPRALGLGGALKLRLQAKGKFLGAYQPANSTIILPKRSNSFSHEWGHALDYYLLDKYVGTGGHGLTGLVRQDGADFQPKNVQEAFVHLLNSMFFDGGELAAKIMKLQARIAETKSPAQKRAYQTQIDNILSGRSKAKEKSRYWQGADVMNKAGGNGDYWTQPTEMFARAFESWVGFKLGNAGFGSEFVGKGDSNYLSEAEDRFKLSFPKGEERMAIFDAFQKLVDQLNIEQAIKASPMGKATVESMSGFSEEAPQPLREEAAKARNRFSILLKPFAKDLEAVETWFHNREVDKEEDARRGADPVKLLSKINNGRSIAFSAAADGVKMVAKRWNSPAALKIHDEFANDLGGTRATPRGWADAIELATNKALNPVFEELERVGGSGWVFKKLTREQKDTLAQLLTGKDVADDMGLTKLASIMRKTFNDAWYMQGKAGLDVGYVKDTSYLNRQIDRELVAGDPDKFTEQARQVYEHVFDRDVGESAEAIATDPNRIETFIDLAKQLGVDGVKELRKALKAEGEEVDPLPIIERMYDAVKGSFSVVRAEAYRDSILHQEVFADHTNAPSLTKSEKPRALPAQADELLRDFYNPDPVSSLVHYTHSAIRRSEWNRRFGRPAGAKKSSDTIAKQLDAQMAAEGVPASDRRFVWDLVDRMSGRYQRKGWLANPAVTGGLAALRVKGSLALMGRTVTLSFFEPASLGIVTGRPMDGLKAVAKTWAAILHKGNRQEMAEWARAHGFVKHHLLEQMMSMDRFGTTSDTPSKLDRLPAAMFRNTGLTFLTHMSEAAVVDVGRRAVLNEMAHRVWNGGARGRDAADLMAELGIRDPIAFSKAIVALNNALPDDDWMNTPEGADYATALQRISRYTIQKPSPAEIAPLGRNPLMSYASYSITAFIQSSYRNLFKRNVIKGLRLLNEHEWTTMARYIAGTLASVGILYAFQALASVAREYAFNPQRQKQWEHDGTWWQNNAGLAAQRTFSFAWGDTIMNAATGLRYNRDLAYLPLGAYAGNDFQNLGKVVKALPIPQTQTPFFQPPSQSRRNNTAEYNALVGAYNFALGPAISAAISSSPASGPIATALGGSAQATMTGPVAAEKFAQAIVGPKDGSIQADGSIAHSGPTAYDKALDEGFGPPQRKNRKAPVYGL